MGMSSSRTVNEPTAEEFSACPSADKKKLVSADMQLQSFDNDDTNRFLALMVERSRI